VADACITVTLEGYRGLDRCALASCWFAAALKEEIPMSPAVSVAEAIAERSRRFETAYGAADANALVEAYFAGDSHGPMALPPGGSPPVRGRASLKAMFAGMFADAPKIRLETVELVASDTVATEIGRAFLTTRDGVDVIGRYVVCWVLTSDGWRAKVDFFAQDGWAD